MGINFAAANMEGYNNPSIEVFKTILTEDGGSLTQYPNKTAILNCLSRGSIPFLFLEDADSLTSWLLSLGSINIQASGNCELSFGTVSCDSPGAFAVLSIFYPEDTSTPPSVNFLEMK